VICIFLIRDGTLGYTLNGNVIDPVISAPIMTALTLGLSLVIIVPLKKIPGQKKLVG
jgi:hypothetical protein